MSKVNGASGASPGVPSGSGDAVNDEDSRFVPPKLFEDGTLRISFPLLLPAQCCVGNCKRGFKGSTWTMIVNSLVRHLKDFIRLFRLGKFTGAPAVTLSLVDRSPHTSVLKTSPYLLILLLSFLVNVIFVGKRTLTGVVLVTTKNSIKIKGYSKSTIVETIYPMIGMLFSRM